jgi:hypothetical protein
MMIARKLFDSFVDALSLKQKEEIYDIAMTDIDVAMAKMANMYEEIFSDYPTGLLAGFIQQHLKDKIFQRTHKQAAA